MIMNSIAIVTDSTADIPEDLSSRHPIFVVPNIIVMGNKSVEDGKGMTRQEFYRSMPSMKSHPTTSTASSGTYHQLYQKLFHEGVQHILSIHASSLLSGIFNAASLAARAFGERIHVIDSQQVTLGLGFQALAAAEAALSEPLENILALIADVRRRVRVIAMLDTLEYVRRSGRVSWAKARLGDWLSIKPLVEVRNGQVLSLGGARTRQKAIQRLKEMIIRLGKLERLAILHTNAEEEARTFLDSLTLDVCTQPFLVNVTTVIGTHAGPNALGFAVVVRNPR
jgi:DegV family protein with EDD domain